MLAESQERNAWQADALIDRIILIALLATSALGVGAAFWRASGRGSDGLGPFGVRAWRHASPPCSCSTGSSRSPDSTT